MKRQSLQRVVQTAVLMTLFGALSTFADDRLEGRTEVGRYGPRDIVGTVTRVAGDGDDFWLRTSRGEVRIEAKGGVRVHYNGQTYRIRDLDRGDYVAVDLQNSSRNKLKARSVEVLRSVSGYGGYGRGGYDDYGRGGYDGYGRGGYDDGRRYARLEGQVVSLDTRRDVMVVRTRSRGDALVNVRELERRYGSSWARDLRRGEWVSIEGYWNGRTLVATALDQRVGWDDGRW